MEGIFVPIGFFLALFAILYVYWTTRTKERLALIEKGQNSGIFKAERQSQYPSLKWGIFFIALGIGVVVGAQLAKSMDETVAFFSSVLICGGIGLIVSYVIVSQLVRREGRNVESAESKE